MKWPKIVGKAINFFTTAKKVKEEVVPVVKEVVKLFKRPNNSTNKSSVQRRLRKRKNRLESQSRRKQARGGKS